MMNLIIVFLSLSASFSLWSQELSYSFLLELGIAALDKEEYDVIEKAFRWEHNTAMYGRDLKKIN